MTLFYCKIGNNSSESDSNEVLPPLYFFRSIFIVFLLTNGCKCGASHLEVATFHSSSCVYIFVYICILKILSQSQTLKKNYRPKDTWIWNILNVNIRSTLIGHNQVDSQRNFLNFFSAQKWTFLNKKNLLKCKYFIVIWPKLLLISNYFSDSTSFH